MHCLLACFAEVPRVVPVVDRDNFCICQDSKSYPHAHPPTLVCLCCRSNSTLSSSQISTKSNLDLSSTSSRSSLQVSSLEKSLDSVVRVVQQISAHAVHVRFPFGKPFFLYGGSWVLQKFVLNAGFYIYLIFAALYPTLYVCPQKLSHYFL